MSGCNEISAGFAKLAAWNVPTRAREHAALIRDQMHFLLGRG
jgi:hypothetical protein